jgi:hypothetical protein
MSAPPAAPAAVRPAAAETRAAIVAWMTNEVSKGTERAYDLGKFAFTVSIGTAALITGLVKDMAESPRKVALMGAILAVLSSVCALKAAWPKTWDLGGDVDLAERYQRSIKVSLTWLRRWAAFYVLAVLGALATILLR